MLELSRHQSAHWMSRKRKVASSAGWRTQAPGRVNSALHSAVMRVGRTCVALQLPDGHCRLDLSEAALQVSTFCSSRPPANQAQQGNGIEQGRSAAQAPDALLSVTAAQTAASHRARCERLSRMTAESPGSQPWLTVRPHWGWLGWHCHCWVTLLTPSTPAMYPEPWVLSTLQAAPSLRYPSLRCTAVCMLLTSKPPRNLCTLSGGCARGCGRSGVGPATC